MKVDIASIIVGDRHRKDMGDLNQLAESIADLGLLQPIGITSDNVLIFGERRLRACRDVLGLTEIEVRVIDMPNIVVGENAENEVRKDFTPSERVAIAQAIEAEIGSRQGQRTDMEHPQNVAEVQKGQETRDFAAQKAGFGNRETYRQAKKVVENAEPEVVEAMDKNVISINRANRISKYEPEVQREIIKTGRTTAEAEREGHREHRAYVENQDPLDKTIILADAVLDIAYAGMSAGQFRQTAMRPTIARLQTGAPAAFRFLKEMVEVIK